MTSGFETLNLHPQLKKAIDALGFTQMKYPNSAKGFKIYISRA